MSKDFVLTTNKNDIIRLTCFGIDNLNSSPCLIFVHGFKGFKDWGFFPYAGKYFAGKGYFVITFNFSHNGIGRSLSEFDEPEKFAENTLSLELDELLLVIKKYSEGYFGKVNNPEIALIGHSRGGAISILAAYRNDFVKAVVTWAAVSELDRFTDRQKKEWKEKGYFEVLNSRTNQLMRMNYSIVEDYEKNKTNKLNLKKAVSELNKPLLLIHGEQDLTVPLQEALDLKNLSSERLTRLEVIPATGHTFDIRHPFEGTNKKFDSVLEKTSEFITENLKRGKNDQQQ